MTRENVADSNGADSVDASGLGVAHRINCGGPAFTDAAGREWSADAGYAPHTLADRDAPDAAEYDAPEMSQDDAALLYGRRRFATRAGRSVAYELPVRRSGAYVLRLHFVEFTPSAAEPGGRVFEVVVQGTSRGVVDLGALVGLRHLQVRAYPVAVESDGGSVTIELLGLVRSPFVSAIELMGPATALPALNELLLASGGAAAGADLSDASATSKPAAVFAPPKAIETITAGSGAGVGTEFHLSHVATGGRHRDDVQFVGVADSWAHLFRVDARREDADNVGPFEAQCAVRCAADPACLGFFVRVLVSSMYCGGLSSVDGGWVATNTRTRSWARDLRDVPREKGAPKETALSREALGVNDGIVPDFYVAFEGRTAENAGGPWLVFTSALSWSERAFTPMDATLRGCADHCRLVRSCAGFVVMADPDNSSHIDCVGLRTLGFRRGAETSHSSLSFVKVATTAGVDGDAASATTAVPATVVAANDDAIDGGWAGGAGQGQGGGGQGGIAPGGGDDGSDNGIVDEASASGGGSGGGASAGVGGAAAALAVGACAIVAIVVWRRRRATELLVAVGGEVAKRASGLLVPTLSWDSNFDTSSEYDGVRIAEPEHAGPGLVDSILLSTRRMTNRLSSRLSHKMSSSGESGLGEALIAGAEAAEAALAAAVAASGGAGAGAGAGNAVGGAGKLAASRMSSRVATTRLSVPRARPGAGPSSLTARKSTAAAAGVGAATGVVRLQLRRSSGPKEGYA